MGSLLYILGLFKRHLISASLGYNEHRSVLRGTSRGGFAGVPRARVSPLRFSWALIEQRKRNKPPLRNRLGSLAAIGLVLARCARCSVVLGAVQCCALCSAGGEAGGGRTMLRAVHRCALCSTARCVALEGGCTMLRTVQRCAQ